MLDIHVDTNLFLKKNYPQNRYVTTQNRAFAFWWAVKNNKNNQIQMKLDSVTV